MAISSSAAFIPSCEAGGAFSPRQCQQGGQCWCVEPSGREVPGTRQHGDQLECSEWKHRPSGSTLAVSGHVT